MPSSLQPDVNAKRCLQPPLCLDQALSREAYAAARQEAAKSLGALHGCLCSCLRLWQARESRSWRHHRQDRAIILQYYSVICFQESLGSQLPEESRGRKAQFPSLFACFSFFLALKVPLKSGLPCRGASPLSPCQQDQCKFATVKWLLPALLFACGG